MADIAEKTSFLRAMAGVCSGTEIFRSLIRQKAWRIVLHLFLVLMVCSVLVPSIRMTVDAAQIRETLGQLQQSFGKIRIYGMQMLPSLRPDEMRVVMLGKQLPLIYVPAKTMPDWEQYREYPVLAVWQPGYLSFVQRLSSTDVMLSSFPLGMTSAMIPTPQKLTMQELSEAFLKNSTALPQKEVSADAEFKIPQEAISEEDFDFLKGMFWAALCGVFWMEAVPPLLIFLTLFIGVFTLTSTVRDRTLRFGELVKAGAYASCPAIFVASFFPALDLPLLEYSTAYMIGAVCYFFVAVNRLERERREASAAPEE